MSLEEIVNIAKGIAIAFCIAYEDHRFSVKVFGDEVWVVFLGLLKVVRIDEEVARKWDSDNCYQLE